MNSTNAGNRSSFARATGARAGRRLRALSTAKSVTAKTVALPKASIVKLSPEATGDGFVAVATISEGDAKAGRLNWRKALAEGHRAVAEARLSRP
mgnify:CR=1 FL=1